MPEKEYRVGMGVDVHQFMEPPGEAKSCEIMLCGVPVTHDKAIKAHSDGDVGLHALVDAMLGAVAMGDIGQHFPPTDMRWKDADSSAFVEHALTLVQQKGGKIVNADITFLCERPKIGPHREAMQARVAELLQITKDRVSIKATTTEKLGFLGRKEGLAAQAAVMVVLSC